MIPHDKVLLVLESRYDYQSARTLLGEALRKAGLAGDKAGFDAGELRSLATAFAGLGQAHAEGVVAALNGLAEPTPTKGAKAAPAPEPAPEPVVEAAPEAAPEGAPEAAPEAGEAEGADADASAEASADKPKSKKKK